MGSFFRSREWIDRRVDPERNCVTEEFKEGINAFISFVCNQASYQERGTMLCPCSRCRNMKHRDAQTVSRHLYLKGFKGNYYIWTCHGENCFDVGESSMPSPSHFVGGEQSNWESDFADYGDYGGYGGYGGIQVPIQNADELVQYGDVNMSQEPPVEDNIPPNVEEEHIQPNVEEDPHPDSVFQAFKEASEPLYDGCVDGLSQLYLASRMMNIKTTNNMSEGCVDQWASTIKHILPQPNRAPRSYYETKKLTRSLGLPVVKIDVCEDNCMLFWKGDDLNLMQCRFCKRDRYYPNNGTGKNKAKKRMFYLPIAQRLSRLYQMEKTASEMRWHAEHVSPEGEMHHPSDGKAWKHFNQVYPEFAGESRNIYLGLSTDGFNPIGMNGEPHSVWPVIVTPYNLPPGMCMKREYFYLAVLVPGPKHPKKSLDIYLQPLIEELQMLWRDGVEAYDVSRKQNFTMKVALMWTISDFPAYGMVSGWMTHGRLSCPYCLDDTNAFWLRHGRKFSWFDCHRVFLPCNHPYRRNLTAFRKGKSVHETPPPWLNGQEILYERIEQIDGVNETVKCGGNGHENPGRTIDGYGDYHNWIKKSIFWELPYWENLLLRHNLDFMHIEKNFFDNLINTVLNAPKTKDNIKSRLDLPEFCNRPDLEIEEDGTVPIPIFRLSKEGKKSFLSWLKKDIRFPDGYASNFSRCVDENSGKLSGLKSHDCHVIMQRLLPFAFLELLPKNVHTAISDIAAFFRDISTRMLKVEDVDVLKENIALKLCNLEKIFPPSFFDVMEHLPVHLPDEAALGGPVQYRWMYPFERYMYHLKKKVKNKAQIGGSIVAQCVQEEISYATHKYYGEEDNDSIEEGPAEIKFTYNYPGVPDMFEHVGRVGGKGNNAWLNDKDYNVLQTFMLINCEEFADYDRMFEEYMTLSHPDITEDALNRCKDKHYAQWCKDYINDASQNFDFPLWMLEFVQGPRRNYTYFPMYSTRGYRFHTSSHGHNKKTQNYGVCVRGTTETIYYGLIEEILLIEYHGAVGLKAMIFKCTWFDTTEGTGLRRHPFGGVDVAPRKRYGKYDPYVLASQCDQVCYIPYPQVGQSRAQDWWACTKVLPRGHRENIETSLTALQDDTFEHVVTPTAMVRVNSHVVSDASDYDADVYEGNVDDNSDESSRDSDSDSSSQ